MAMIHVNRGATSLGAFPEEQVREGIRAGRFLPSDLGWREGMASWQPLSQFSEFGEDVAAAAPAPAAPPTQTPTPPAMVAPPAGSTTAAPRSGLPWDERHSKGLFHGFIETLQMVIALFGGLIVGVWNIVLYCSGLARAHETDTGRAVLAVFLPLILCCGGVILCAMLFGGIGAMMHNWNP